MGIIVVPIIAEVKSSREQKDQSVNGVLLPKILLILVVEFMTSVVEPQVKEGNVVIKKFYLVLIKFNVKTQNVKFLKQL
jgi:hypothetical protein